MTMCYTCAFNPIDVIDDARSYKKEWDETERKRYKATLIKHSLKMLESEEQSESWGPRCDIGNGIVTDLKEAQYKLSREL